MPRPAQRTRNFVKKKVTTPGGRITTHYVKKRSGVPKCGACGRELPGVARGSPAEVARLAKSERKPERPYGGNLCSPCTRKLLKSKNLERWEND